MILVVHPSVGLVAVTYTCTCTARRSRCYAGPAQWHLLFARKRICARGSQLHNGQLAHRAAAHHSVDHHCQHRRCAYPARREARYPHCAHFKGGCSLSVATFHAVKNFMPINGNSVHVGVPMGRRKRERRGGGVHMFVHICTIRSCSEGKRPDGEVDSFAFKVQLSDYVYAAIGQLVPGMFEHTKATCRMVAQNSISLLSCIK